MTVSAYVGNYRFCLHIVYIIRPRRSRSAGAYSRQTFPWTICRSVRPSTSVRLRLSFCLQSVCPLHCGKTADRIRMPFGILGRTGPGMRQVVGFGDRSTGRGTFGANLRRAVVFNGNLLRTCATVPRRGPLPKLLWADLFKCVRRGSFVRRFVGLHCLCQHVVPIRRQSRSAHRVHFFLAKNAANCWMTKHPATRLSKKYNQHELEATQSQ